MHFQREQRMKKQKTRMGLFFFFLLTNMNFFVAAKIVK